MDGAETVVPPDPKVETTAHGPAPASPLEVDVSIPRILHQVWLGGDPIPPRYNHYRATWRRHHPDWEFRLWSESELAGLLDGQALRRCRNHAERSDLLRYRILHRTGGVYIDMDVECLRPIDPLLEGVSAFAGWARPGTVGTAIVGSAPGHPRIVEALEFASQGAGFGNQVKTTGPGVLTRVFADAEDVTIYESELLYPFDHSDLPLPDDAEFPDAFTIHHWDGSWKTRDLLQRRKRQLRKRLKHTQAELREARRAEQELAKRLAAIEGSLWWQLRVRSARLARRLRARHARAGRGGDAHADDPRIR